MTAREDLLRGNLNKSARYITDTKHACDHSPPAKALMPKPQYSLSKTPINAANTKEEAVDLLMPPTPCQHTPAGDPSTLITEQQTTVST